MQRFGETGVEKFVSEYALITHLLRKIMDDEAVRTRWIPSFSPPIKSLNSILSADIGDRLLAPAFEIRGVILARPRTMSQWFYDLLVERVKRGLNGAIGLRTMLYCLAWAARLISDRDFARLEQSAGIIKAWLLQDSCRDCVYKFLRELREDYAFEYVFNVADSFSAFVRLPDIRASVLVLECGDAGHDRIAACHGFLRTFGRHSFLTSPFAKTSLKVEIKVLNNSPPKSSL